MYESYPTDSEQATQWTAEDEREYAEYSAWAAMQSLDEAARHRVLARLRMDRQEMAMTSVGIDDLTPGPF